RFRQNKPNQQMSLAVLLPTATDTTPCTHLNYGENRLNHSSTQLLAYFYCCKAARTAVIANVSANNQRANSSRVKLLRQSRYPSWGKSRKNKATTTGACSPIGYA